MSKSGQEIWDRIDSIVNPTLKSLRSASWLRCDYAWQVWTIVLIKQPLIIDWRVMLDGDWLTSPRHAKTLETMKDWLLLQTHQTLNIKPLNPVTAAQRIRRILHVLDYLLLNEASIGFGRRGFMALNENDVRNFFIAIERDSSDSESIYQWTARLCEYLKGAPQVSDEEVKVLRENIPELFEVETPEADWRLELTREQLVRGRINMWKDGFYKRRGMDGFYYSPDTTRIAKAFYPNLLSQPYTHLSFEELGVSAIDSYMRELPGVDVRTAEVEGTQHSRTSAYKREFFSLRMLHQFGRDVPLHLLDSIDQLTLIDPRNLKLPGRYRTLPFPVSMKALKNGTEFFYEHGVHLTSSYVNLVSAAASEKLAVEKFVATYGVVDVLDQETRKLGVTDWSVASYFDPRFHLRSIHRRTRVATPVYFSTMRKNVGLVDLIRVLYGGCQSTVGTMMARRNKELLDLVAGQALSEDGTDLAFFNGKTGVVNFRQVELRPIPSVGTDMIALLTEFQEKLVAAGALKELTKVFALPTATGKLVASATYYNFAFDAFCDYFEMPTKAGERYYIRQHQLRRVFAIAFLYAAGGDAETLRWFLGHLDPEHLWHYITDAMPGEMLQYVEAYFLSEKLQSSEGDLVQDHALSVDGGTEDKLRHLVKERFGTSNYALLNTEILTDFMVMQIREGMVVEPHFYESVGGKTYRILVHFKGNT